MPAILALPFVGVFGKGFPQQILAHLLGAGIVAFVFKMSILLKKDLKIAIWAALFSGLGTIVWFLSSVGSAWYLGQISATFFLTAAITLALEKKHPFFIGLLLGAAYLSRLHTILALPLFLYLLKDRGKLPLFLGIAPFLAFNGIYNFIRFGVFWDKAYTLIPGIFNEPWYDKGLFHPSYIFRHLKTAFFSFPVFQRQPPFILPSWSGLAIFLTTPAFVYAFFASFREQLVKLSWLSIFLILAVVFTHGTTGFAQFGYRFAVDFYPIFFLLTIKGVVKTGLKKHHWILLFFGILVNLWGVLWINKLGWVI